MSLRKKKMRNLDVQKDSRNAHTQRKGHVRIYRENAATCKTRRKAAGETEPADTLISDFKPPGL